MTRKKSDYLHIRIDGADRTKATQIAHSHGMTLSEYVRAVVALGPRPTRRDVMQARDEIEECIVRNMGIAKVKNQPPDLTAGEFNRSE